MKKQDYPGPVFTGKVYRPEGRLPFCKIFLEGNPKAVGKVIFSDEGFLFNDFTMFDKALQKWVLKGDFSRVKDPEIISALSLKQSEYDVVWYRKTFRFVPAQRYSKKLRFVLTTDKSDLGKREKRILQVGEEIMEGEEAEQRKADKLREQEKLERKERTRLENADRIVSVAKSAIRHKAVPPNEIKLLFEAGVIEPTTTFRSGALYRGEDTILWYDFTAEGERFAGYIGFDKNLALISIDERFPNVRETYLG